MAAGPVRDADGTDAGARLQVTLLGAFTIKLGQLSAGPWYRPPAKRLCELVMLSGGRRVVREVAMEMLFPELAPGASARALSVALSQARQALSPLGEAAAGLLRADRSHIWLPQEVPIDVDLVTHEESLRAALKMGPGGERDAALSAALVQEDALLEDEPYADWALQPREALDLLRQRARLELARDRARGWGRSQSDAVIEAWEGCLAHDASSEEAASALIRVYSAQGRAAQAQATYRRCRSTLEQLGLRVSPALEEVHATVTSVPLPPQHAAGSAGGMPSVGPPEERRLVTVLFAELSGPGFQRLDAEDLRDVVSDAVAGLIAIVEVLGGTVTSVSGAGLVALFGAPIAHEDDPERALRAGYRALAGLGRKDVLSARLGIETGQAVVGPIGRGPGTGYVAVGEVVGVAAALQSVAKQGSMLVGPATRAAVEPLFEWGPTEEALAPTGDKPLVGCYLERPKARRIGQADRRRLAAATPLVGRQAELRIVRESLREVTSGRGNVLLVVSEPGLGKTRLVQECRKSFMAWVGAVNGRLPLWVEGRAASYLSSRAYGLYQQLLSAWVGVAPEEEEEAARAALGRAMKAAIGAKGKVDSTELGLLAQVMGIGAGEAAPALSQLPPEQLQRATFEAMSALVSHLVSYGPTVVVLEDLHWADPTSLRLTKDLASLAKQGPLLLILTRRPEPDPGVSTLEAALGEEDDLVVRKLELFPLSVQATHELAGVLLGPGAPNEVLAATTRGTEGNPLFLEERLSSMLETRALVKREGRRWRLDDGVQGEVPQALDRLVRSRVDRLGRGARDAAVAASVLGLELTFSALVTVTDLDGGLAAAVAELCSAGLFVEVRKLPEPTYRFRHALIQEAIYNSMLRKQRQHLHARAAWGMEAASAGQLEGVAGLLGRHYAMAGEGARAAHFLDLAGDHAASVFAMDEAIASYRWALELLDAEAQRFARQSVELMLKLGQIYWRLARCAEGRVVLHEAATLAAVHGSVLAASCYCRLGRIEEQDHEYEEALRAFETGERLLKASADKDTDEWVETWLDLQSGRALVYYWRAETDLLVATLAAARPLLEARGTPRQRADFSSSLLVQRGRATRYRYEESDIAYARAAWEAATEAGLQNEMYWMRFHLAMCLLFHGDLEAAQTDFEAVLEVSRRAGDRPNELRCLVYLACTRLRQHDVAGVREIGASSEELAQELGYPEYEAMAKALRSWVAWQDGHLTVVEELAQQAVDQWRSGAVKNALWFIALWPLVAVRLARGRCQDAVDAARELLDPVQMRLSPDLEAAVESAISTWDAGEHEKASTQLSGALQLAKKLRFA